MSELWNSVVTSLSRFDWIDAVDILIVTVLIYYLLKLASKTRAMQVLKGIGLIFIAARVCAALRLQAVSWILNYVINAGALVIVVLFQPELRRALEQIGRGRFLEPLSRNHIKDEGDQELIRALLNLAKQRVGALIVIQRYVALEDIIETGTRIDGTVSSALLETIFKTGTALHDGAVVMKDGVVLAAGCFLPLTARQDLDQTVGTRHRAAIGMSEASDAIVFVVSEESGTISAAVEGRFLRNLNANTIRHVLHAGDLNEDGSAQTLITRLRNRIRRGQ